MTREEYVKELRALYEKAKENEEIETAFELLESIREVE